MRLAGQAKLGFYPTPLSQVALIAPWLEVVNQRPKWATHSRVMWATHMRVECAKIIESTVL